MRIYQIIIIMVVLYSCSPINKQHGYLVDDFLMSSDNILEFSEGKSNKSNIFKALGSPSVEIYDVNDVWIYLISIKEKKVFDKDIIQDQMIYRYVFDENGILKSRDILTKDNFTKIEFSKDKTTVIRDAYGITDQLYDAFTKGQ